MGIIETIKMLAREEGEEIGFEIGFERGMKIGMAKGLERAQALSVQKLLDNSDFDTQTIATLLGIPVSFVEKVKAGSENS